MTTFTDRLCTYLRLSSVYLVSAVICGIHPSHAQTTEEHDPQTAMAELLSNFCEDCHNDYQLDGNWSLSDISVRDIELGKNQKNWESILRSVSMGDMPPAGKKQPSAQAKTDFLEWLENSLNQYASVHPNPGRATLRRLNRYEYANSVRDLLAIDIDIAPLLPGDDSGYGFDNNADVLGMSTTLLDRYLSVAGKVSRLATGTGASGARTTSYTVPKNGSVKNSGLPAHDLRMNSALALDSRGGGAFEFYAPSAGVYEIAGYLNANTNNEVDRLDIHRRSVKVTLAAGKHSIGMSFRKRLALREFIPEVREGTDYVVLPEQPPSPLALDFFVDNARVHTIQVPSYHMSARFSQAAFLRDVLQIDVIGPLAEQSAPASFAQPTPSERKIFSCEPGENKAPAIDERDCAEQILSNLTRQAYRRPISPADTRPLLAIFEQARSAVDFKTSIAAAIQALLVAPNFLYLQEPAPQSAKPNELYTIDDYQFAARLALFLWSSLPDQELLDLAEQNRLREPAILGEQLTRMLASPKASALTDNFAGQWLYLRNLPYHYPDVFEFPEFDIPLRQAIKRETELFFSQVVRQNQSIFEFLNADYSYLNERLAQHYGIDGVRGTEFRKVPLASIENRGGLLGHASILTLTSNPNHTSPVKRGKWILDNLLAATPPPPPPDVPALVAEHDGVALTAKEQLARHREDPVCAACHIRMDPLGLSLEQYDAVGGFRTVDAGQVIDVQAQMPDGTQFNGLTGLHDILWDRRERFTQAFIDRLLTYALGRGLEPYDQPVIRDIASYTAQNDYRIHALIKAIVTSTPFNLRRASSQQATVAEAAHE